MAGNCYKNGTMVLEMIQTKDSPSFHLQLLSTRESPNHYGNDVTISTWYKARRKQKCYQPEKLQGVPEE